MTKKKKRKYEFRECIVYLDEESDTPQFFFGSSPGTLAKKPRGKMKQYLFSDIARLFIPKGQTKTLAEMTRQEYDFWKANDTYRVSASKKFAEWYSERRDI